MSPQKQNYERIILQVVGSIIGIFLFALGGGCFIQALYATMYWVTYHGNPLSLFLVSEGYIPAVWGTIQGFALIGFGLVLMIWSRPR